MKKAIVCLCGAFSITTASATVYDGTYTGNIKTTNDSLIEKGTVFDDAQLYVANGTTLTILDNVQFINDGHIVPYGTAAFNIAISGNNVTFRNNKNTAIMAGVYNYEAFDRAYAGQLNVSISGNHTVFDNNHATQYSNYVTRGGAIFLGVPSSRYYSPYIWYTQALHIDGEDTVFSNNTAGYGGAIYSNSGFAAASKAVEFSNNSASYGGGAIYITNDNTRSVRAKLELAENTMFISNAVTRGNGGAIYNKGSYAYIGAGSIFRGNTAKNGGAIYNDGEKATIDIDTGGTGVYFETASDSIYNNGGIINFLGTGTIAAGLTSLTSVRGDGKPVINLGRTSVVFDTVNLQDNTTLKTTIWRDGDTVRVGNLAANVFNIQNNDELKLQIAVDNRQVLSIEGEELIVLIDRTGTQEAGWDLFGNPDKHPKYILENNLAYDIEFVRDGVYKITPKAFITVDPSDDSDVVPNVSQAWNMTGFVAGSAAESIANEMHRLSQFADTRDEYENALELVAPDAVGVAENVINRLTNANMRIINQRMLISKPGFWTIGGYSALGYNDYSGNVIGGTVGQDVALSNSLKIGMAFGYSTASIDSDSREFGIDSPFDMSLYAKLNIPAEQYDIYTNLIFNHSAYNINENKTVVGYGIESEFEATQTSAQATFGFMRGWWGIDAGVRHNNLNLGSYTDSISQHVAGATLNTTYALVGLKLGNNSGRFQWGANIGGEFIIAGDDAYTGIITAPNNQRYYHTTGIGNDTALTFGASMDVAITDALSLGLAYNGLIAGEYSEHMGKLRFNWAW